MKHFLPTLILLLAMRTASVAQMVTIPDANMVSYLTQLYPTCMSGNQLDTTCTLITNAPGISLYNKGISNFEGIQYFDAATTLDISMNPATTISVFPRQLQTFTANDVPLTSIGALPSTLQQLMMKNNFLTVLPALPASLIVLSVEANDLASLPALPAGLASLQVPHNNLTALPTLPPNLGSLSIYNNQVTTLPALPVSLTNLDIKVNQISTLPTLPPNLYSLDVSNNLLSSLPATLPNSITTFHCGYNSLTSLPATLPPGLTNFSCGGNSLTVLPALPSTLTYLACHQNQLTALPTLPPDLTFVICNDNQLTSLPPLPQQPQLGFVNISCQNNQITCFPPLPDGLVYNLFPNPATCLPNYTAGMSATLLAMPLCVQGNTTINPNGCQDGTGIYGAIFRDGNANCQFDAAENTLMNLPVELRDGGNLLQRTFTTANGRHYLNAPAGTYAVSVDTSGLGVITTTCPVGFSQSVTLTPAAPVANNVDFEMHCNGSVDVGVQAIYRTGLVFPGDTHAVRVLAGDLTQWYGLNCANGMSGTITVTFSGPATFISTLPGTQTPTINGNVFTYTVADFGTWSIMDDIGFYLRTDTNAQVTDTICLDVLVTTGATDALPLNNLKTLCYRVVNSFDPNMKETYPEHLLPGAEDFITYTIHFQNNGTAPARLVKLLDTLDAGLDWTTLEPTAYSHYCEPTLTGNVLSVRYPNINLIDSATNYAASQGFFQFRIRPLPGRPTGTVIENFADIYFDFNSPIRTNTTENVFDLQVGAEKPIEHAFVIYPNPANSTFAIHSSKASAMEIKITDVAGRTILQKQGVYAGQQVDVQTLPAGLYLVTVWAKGAVPATLRLTVE